MPAVALVAGLTGGLATGKSTVLARLAELGAATVDADRIARDALAPGSPLLRPVRDLLGDAAFRADGTLDRARAADLVFADPARRRALEALVHPEVLRREDEEVAAHVRAGADLVVVDAALLVEAGRAARFARLIVTTCPVELQVRRAVARGMAEADARRRIAAQLPAADKERLADYVVDTSGTLAATLARAGAVHAALREDVAELAAGRPLPPRR